MSDTAHTPAYFAIITMPVLRNRALAANAKILYASITALSDERGYCWASNQYLAEQFGWGERTVSRLIAQLCDLGFLRYEMVLNPETKRMERHIYIGGMVAEGVAKIGDTCQYWRGGVAKIGDQINIDYNTPPIIPPTGDNAAPKRKRRTEPAWKPDRFEGFWAYYRDNARGEDRAGAVREWDRLRPDDALIDTMAKALKAQVATEEWQRGVGIPYACRWIKNERWRDRLRGDTPQEDAPPQRRYIGTKIVDGEEVDVYE